MTDPLPLEMIHRFIPATPGSTTLLLLHGTGGDENDLIPLGQMVMPGAALLSVRGSVLENGMPRFFRRIAEGVFDLPDLKRRTQELADFLLQAYGRYGISADQVIALGYSNGANIASSVLLSRPEVLAGVALLRPMVPFVPAALPDLRKKRVLIAAGKDDPTVPPGQVDQLAELLRKSGAHVTLQVTPGGHGLAQHDVDSVKAWLKNL
ncbi:MAG: alpha/beta hydrolase [Gemmatimonadota bacterium]